MHRVGRKICDIVMKYYHNLFLLKVFSFFYRQRPFKRIGKKLEPKKDILMRMLSEGRAEPLDSKSRVSKIIYYIMTPVNIIRFYN